ncbi:MAG: hypothetical protein K2H70_02220 [Bacteroidales bacterium]|nr:hypothetical protein [Bacteroidales bacterium]
MKRYTILLPLVALLAGCRQGDPQPAADNVPNAQTAAQTAQTSAAPIFPDYGDSIVLPPNIAPLNFAVNEKIHLRLSCGGETLIDRNYRRQVRFRPKAWRRWLNDARERQQPLRLEMSTADRSYAPLHWFVAEDSIDPYLVYRLVAPGDGVYNTLGIYQRRLSNFKTTALTLNTVSDNNCMNCHTFRNGEANEMIIHWRFPSEGSLLQTTDGPCKIALSPEATRLGIRLIYPAFHPQGRYIAFSTNHLLGIGGYDVHRRFFNSIDSLSHIVLYDIETNRLFTTPALWDNAWEYTYPAWSPDGDCLYFCRAPKEDSVFLVTHPTEKQRIARIRFDLVRVSFNPATGTVGDSVQTLLAADDYQGSFALPRVNPANPNCIAVNISPYSSFPARAYGDLGLVFPDGGCRTVDGNMPHFEPADALNSPEAESFHSWSRNGRWLVYASKQADGYFSFPYIAYFDGRRFAKPFILPQKDGRYYRGLFKSFNLPELTVTSATLTPRKTEKLRKGYALTINADDLIQMIKQDESELETPR